MFQCVAVRVAVCLIPYSPTYTQKPLKKVCCSVLQYVLQCVWFHRARYTLKNPLKHSKSTIYSQQSSQKTQDSPYSVNWALDSLTKTLHTLDTALYSPKRGLHILNRALCSLKRDLYTHNRALQSLKRVVCTLWSNAYSRAFKCCSIEPLLFSKETYIHKRDPWNLSKESYVHSEQMPMQGHSNVAVRHTLQHTATHCNTFTLIGLVARCNALYLE